MMFDIDVGPRSLSIDWYDESEELCCLVDVKDIPGSGSDRDCFGVVYRVGIHMTNELHLGILGIRFHH